MQRTPHRCPGCSELLSLSSDMWGFYYLCEACAWTCEDDDRILDARRRFTPVTPNLLDARPEEQPRPRLTA